MIKYAADTNLLVLEHTGISLAVEYSHIKTWADSNGPRKDQNNWFHIVLILTSISWPSHWRVLNK